jgi:hypothetical protein
MILKIKEGKRVGLSKAERDLRMIKCKKKVSGGLLSTQGANQFARIKGFISTACKKSLNILNIMKLFF